MNWDDTPSARKISRNPKQRGPLDYTLWTLIAILTVIALLRYTIWYPKDEVPVFNFSTMSHIAQYVSDIKVIDGALEIQQTVVLDSHAKEGFRGLSTYMPKSIDPGIDFQYRIHLAMRGDRVIDIDKLDAAGGQLVSSRGVEVLKEGQHTFTLIYTVRNAITNQGDNLFIRWPASSLWRTPVARQTYRWFFPAHLELKSDPNFRVLLLPSAKATLQDLVEINPEQFAITSEKNEEGLRYTIAVQQVLLPGQQTFIEASWPLTDFAINQRKAIETKPQWEAQSENSSSPLPPQS